MATDCLGGTEAMEVDHVNRKPSRPRACRTPWTLGVLLCLTGGCRVLPEIGVCKRQLNPELLVNVRPEGNQVSSGTHAVAAMPLTGAFAVFFSDVSGSFTEQNTEIRGTLLDDDGKRVDTCGEPQEVTYASPVAGAAPVQRLYGASVAPPVTADTDALGLIAYVWLNADAYDSTNDSFTNASGQIFGAAISAIGCPVKGVTAFQISNENPGNIVSPPAVVALGKNRFVVLWTVLQSPSFMLRARVFDLTTMGPSYLDTTNPLTGFPTAGEAVSIRPAGEQPVDLDAVGLGDNRFALAWVSIPEFGGGVTVHIGIFDDRLGLENQPVVIDDGSASASMPSDLRIALAYDGNQLMIAWPQRDANSVSRVYGRLVNGAGFPTSDSFRLGSRVEGEEGGVSLTAQNGGGFLCTWEEQEASGGGESGVSLRLAAYSAAGAEQFTNQACDRSDFRLNRAAPGNQRWASLTKMSNGTVEAVWTDFGSTEVNSRGTSEIRSVAISQRALLPQE